VQPGDEDLACVPFSELTGRHVVVEEKVDGANAAISFDARGCLWLQSRGHFLTGSRVSGSSRRSSRGPPGWRGRSGRSSAAATSCTASGCSPSTRSSTTRSGAAQGAVVDAARQAARRHLRRGQPFIWNATNLSREVRTPLVESCHRYRARVRIVVVEAAPAVVDLRNQARTRPVPPAAFDRMLDRWQAPDWTEAHQLTWHGAEVSATSSRRPCAR
jgi:predicted kinase